MSKSRVLPWSQCSSLVQTAHERTHLLVWRPVFFCVCTNRINIQHWIYYPPSRAYHEHTIFICTSPGLQIDCTTFYKESCTDYVHQWFPTPAFDPGSAWGFLSPRPTPAALLEVRFKKKSTLGLLRAENYWCTRTAAVSPVYPHFKCDRQ